MARKPDLELMRALMQNEVTMLAYVLIGLLVIVSGLAVRIFAERAPMPVWAYLVFAGIVSAAYGVSAYLRRRQVLLAGNRELGGMF